MSAYYISRKYQPVRAKDCSETRQAATRLPLASRRSSRAASWRLLHLFALKIVVGGAKSSPVKNAGSHALKIAVLEHNVKVEEFGDSVLQ